MVAAPKGHFARDGLISADAAVFRDELMRFLVGAADEAAATELRQDIERLRASGELAQIVKRMRPE